MNELQSTHPQSAGEELAISKLLRLIVNFVAVAAVVLAALASATHSDTSHSAETRIENK
jgi:hypothetical protein